MGEEEVAGIPRPRCRGAHYPAVPDRASDLPAPDAALDGLLRRFLEGADESAMEALVRRTRPRLLGAARRIGDPQDAEDSVQAAYHALLRRGPAPTEGPVVAWLLTAVVRIAYRRKASARRREDIARRLAPRNPEPDPASRIAAAEEVEALRRALERLPAKYRDTLVLHHLQGLPVTDVALLLEAPESTVKARLRRGRAVLRSRLSPSFHSALCAVPWALEDAGRGLSSGVHRLIGGAVKAKVVAAATLLAVAAIGGAAWTLLGPGPSEPAAPPPPKRPAPSRRTDGAPPAEAAEAPRPEEFRSPAPSAPSAPMPSSGAPPGDSPEVPHGGARPGAPGGGGDAAKAPAEPLPDAVRAAAAAEGITEAALQAAWTAYLSGKANTFRGPYRIVEPAALDTLKAQGADGFRAVAALLRGGKDGTWFRDLVGASWSPGLENLLFAVSEDAALTPSVRWSALDSLCAADAPATREFLVARAGSEPDPYLVWGVARALANLKEPRGAEPLSKRIEDRAAGDIVRRSFISMIGDMDPAVARRALVDRLALPDADLLVDTVQALERVDAEAARREAGSLLDGPRAPGFNPKETSALRRLAGRTQTGTPR